MLIAALLAASSGMTAFSQSDSLSLGDVVAALHGSDKLYNDLESSTSYWEYWKNKEAQAPDRDHDMTGTASLPSKYDLRDVDGINYDHIIRKSYHGGWCYVNPKFSQKIIQGGCTYDVALPAEGVD